MILLGYDEIIETPANTDSCSYCLQANEVEALLGLLEYQNWRTRWYSLSGLTVVQDTIDTFVDGLRTKLMAGCTEEVLSRFTSDGVFQTSPDGGATWVDDPGADPRNMITIAPPAPGDDGDDKRCAGSNSVVTMLKNTAEQIAVGKDNEASLSDLGLIFVGILVVIGIITAGWLFALMGAFIATVWANYTAAEWRAQFTDEFWQQITCIVYQWMNADASVTDRVGLGDQISAEVADSIAREFVLTYIGAYSNSGLTNAARLMLGGSYDCVCGCSPDNYELWPGAEDYGTLVTSDSTSATYDMSLAPTTVGEYFLRVKVVPGIDPCYIDHWEVVSGAAPNVWSFTADGETEGTRTHALPTDAGSQEFLVHDYALGAALPSRIKIVYDTEPNV